MKFVVNPPDFMLNDSYTRLNKVRLVNGDASFMNGVTLDG